MSVCRVCLAPVGRIHEETCRLAYQWPNEEADVFRSEMRAGEMAFGPETVCLADTRFDFGRRL